MPKNTFAAIPSVPCFEYWLLLHFGYTTKSYQNFPGKSICTQVIKDLMEHIPAYEKKQKGIFLSLYPKLEDAKKFAAMSLKYAKKAGTDNPTTRIHELVDFLQNIKKQK